MELIDKNGSIYTNRLFKESDLETLYHAFDYCREQFENNVPVDLRKADNNSVIAGSVNSFWDLKKWLMEHKQSNLQHILHDYCRGKNISLPYTGIYFGSSKNEIYNTSIYFKNQYQPSWLLDPINQEMIKDIDKSIVKGNYLIESPVLGEISPFMLSGGVKTLILIREQPDKVFNASNCGDNCAKWILKMSKGHDFTVTMHHIMDFSKKKLCFYIINSGHTVTTMNEYLDEAANYL